MIEIHKTSAPKDLEEYKNKLIKQNLTPEIEYFKLKKKSSVKKTVQESLLKEQGHLCAYCMRQIPEDNTEEGIAPYSIEHWKARNDPVVADLRGTGLGVEYTNLLVVCSGGRRHKTDDVNSVQDYLHCDAKRGNIPLTVNPLDGSTLSTITYHSNGEIDATDPIIKNDLVTVLNLNCTCYHSFPERRKAALSEIEKTIVAIDDVDDRIKRCEKYLARFNCETDPKTPYCGYIIWWLERYLERLKKDAGNEPNQI